MRHQGRVIKDPPMSISKAEVHTTVCSWDLLRNCEDIGVHQNQARAWSVKVGCRAYLDASQEGDLVEGGRCD